MLEKIYKNKNWLEEQYLLLKYTSEISKKFNINEDTLEYWRKKYNIKKDVNVYHAKKYIYNEFYFDNINTSEKAYWLGFIMADGCVTSSNGKQTNRLEIVLAVKDKSHLQKFLQCIGSNQEVKIKTVKDKRGFETTRAYVRICSAKICKSLSKFGVLKKKTGKELIPEISNDFIWDFIRGYFDGDGSITKPKNLAVKICSSSKQIVNQIIEAFREYNIIVKPQEYSNYNIPFYIIETNKKENIISIYKNMYSNATIYLERKKIIFESAPICNNANLSF